MRLRYNTYSNDNYTKQFSVNPCVLLGEELRNRYKYVDNKKTEEVIGKSLQCYYPNLGLQRISLPKAFELPKGLTDMQKVELINPEAVVVNNNIYVRADGIKQAKE